MRRGKAVRDINSTKESRVERTFTRKRAASVPPAAQVDLADACLFPSLSLNYHRRFPFCLDRFGCRLFPSFR